MGLFIYDDYFTDLQRYIIDSVVTMIFIIELIYNFINQPTPRYLFWKAVDTHVDIITILSPFIAYLVEVNVSGA